MHFEVCVESLEGALAAVRGGATRLEVCSSLLEGGLTPSAGLVREIRRHCQVPIHVMVRPRGGDFLYRPDEVQVMLSDLEFCHFAEVDGVVFGALDSQGEVDLHHMGELMRAAHPLPVTFHRAFDVCRTPVRALEQLIQLGVRRVLTSGQQATAFEGRALIAALVRQARDRIVLMAGGGVNSGNIQALLQDTRVREVHFSGREDLFNHPVQQGSAAHLGLERARWGTSEGRIRATVQAALG